MIKTRFLYFILFIFFAQSHLISQVTQKIKFKKSGQEIYFFQKGNTNDTICTGKGDVFYLRVHDSLKEVFTLLSENAQFVAVSGDTLFQLRYIPGLRYEHIYKKSDAGISGFTFHTLVNGASVAEKQRVIIQILNRRESGILLENKFIFRDKCE